ncbi:MAG: hypothetical protein B7Z66_03570 [Chromatiales bacterium 21-64-14]|nr:MAG: hypothetical protein B7Z66_03570 [Chromatiales bacterium 21-64-14]HQU14843.1 TIGR04211 family SH3 domain-containing protein [Gammaproteobacteria bacterium]
MRKAFFLTTLLLFSSAVLAAQTVQYISDHLELPMRSGQSTQNRILRMVPSGTPVDVLQTSTSTGYSQIRTRDGTQGWVLTRFLMQTPSARDQLTAAEQKLAKLEIENAQIKKQAADLGGKAGTQGRKLAQLEQDKQDLAAELNHIKQTAANALAIDSENRDLKARSLTQARELQALRQEADLLKDRSQRDWFLAGAGVLGGGILLGLILPRVRLRRKGGWNAF